MKTKDVVIGVAILIALAVVFACLNYFKPKFANNNPTQIELNFRKSGRLVKDNPGIKPGVWHLLYEMPGAPAVSKELRFDENSYLFINEKSQAYSESLLYNGLYVVIEGLEQNNIVQVKYLNELADIDPPMKTTVKLYYYNPEKDKDATGNILCSRQGLVSVDRQIAITNDPIEDTVKLLLRGELTVNEKAQGISTEYPLSGVELVGADLKNGVLTLELSDPQNKTGGGSCRIGVLWFQIEATAKQFQGVNQVKFKPEELFQP